MPEEEARTHSNGLTPIYIANKLQLLLWFGSMAVVTYLVRIETRNARACAHHLLQGQKDSAYFNPSGLLATSTSEHGEGVIFVALNYRLGLFGWLNGQGDKDIFPNTALQDQRLGLKWYNRPTRDPILSQILTPVL